MRASVNPNPASPLGKLKSNVPIFEADPLFALKPILVPFWSTVLVAMPAWATGISVVDATKIPNTTAILIAFMLAESWYSRWGVAFRRLNPH